MHLQCKYCNWQGVPTLTKAGAHIKATCPECRKYIRLVPHDECFHYDVEDDSNVCKHRYGFTIHGNDGIHDHGIEWHSKPSSIMAHDYYEYSFSHCPDCGEKLT